MAELIREKLKAERDITVGTNAGQEDANDSDWSVDIVSNQRNIYSADQLTNWARTKCAVQNDYIDQFCSEYFIS